MKIKENDKFVLNKTGFIGNAGDVFDVVNVNDNGYVKLKNETENTSSEVVVSVDFVGEYFTYVAPKQNKHSNIDYDDIDYDDITDIILDHSDITMTTVFDTCVIVAVKLPNGIVLVESCNITEDEDEEVGYDICISNIYDRIDVMRSHAIVYDSSIDMILDGSLDDNADCDSCDYADSCTNNSNYKAVM